MSFRVRLLLAILIVVNVTTAATLIIAQRQNSTIYRNVVDELFSLQSTAFLREQAAQHATAAEQVSRLASSVRLFAALEERDPDVYKIAADELRLGEYAFFRLEDRDGRIIPVPPDSRAGMPGLTELRLPAQPSAGSPVTGEGVQLGFLALPERRQGRVVPFRLLTASITSFGAHVGRLVLAQKIGPGQMGQDYGPGTSSPADGEQGQTDDGGSSPILSALLIDDGLAGSALPPALEGALVARLRSEAVDTDPTLSVGSSTWLYRKYALNEGSIFPVAWLVSAVSMDAFAAEQRALAWRIALTGIVASLLAGVFAIVLSRLLAEPVAQLVEATRAIREGNYALRLAPSSTREMKTLAESFNDMAAGLELKERYHSVLSQVTDPQVAEGLISGRVKLGGELRDVTVMFCDIRGYTALTVGRRPEEIIELLNHHMGAMAGVVQVHRGVINQFAGDAIMALFGAPQSYGDDAQRAVLCAVAMMARREQMNTEVDQPIRVGIGLASGEMVAGCIGAEHRNDYTVVGERVNLAARLCSTAKAGEILVDDATRARMGTSFDSEPIPPLILKGFSTPMPAYRVSTNVAQSA